MVTLSYGHTLLHPTNRHGSRTLFNELNAFPLPKFFPEFLTDIHRLFTWQLQRLKLRSRGAVFPLKKPSGQQQFPLKPVETKVFQVGGDRYDFEEINTSK
jgi:hypothetical protein